jgi:hypothetical protein
MTLSSSGAGAVAQFSNISGSTFVGVDNLGGYIVPTQRGLAMYDGSGTKYLYVTSSGVGIGTTNPSQLLEVVGGEIKAGRVDSSNEGGQVSFGRASDNATGYYIDVYGNTSTPDLRFVDTSNSAVRMILTGAGNIQIDNGQLNTPKSLYFQANSSVGGNLGSIDWYNVQWDGFVRAQIKAETDTGLSNGRLVFSTGGGGVTERMRITSDGKLYFNQGANSGYRVIIGATNGTRSMIITDPDAEGYAGGVTAVYIAKNSGTNRSINAAGTVNASGADYAEYMIKSNSDIIFAKGDIIGVNIDGKLTDAFAEAISFVVKSTDPSYVGGDTWFTEVKPGKTDGITDEEYTIIEAEWDVRYQAARKTIDRIAFSGQIPCNVTGANVGDYIIPIELENGKIGGQAITTPTFEQYQMSVGKVWKIMEDNRAWIAVKIG